MSEKISFAGRTVIVTGGGNGLGRDYCLEIARRGGRVVVNDLGGSGSGAGASSAAADQVVAEIKAFGGEAVANYDSVATRAGGEAIVATALQAFGRVDVLISNAGFLRNNRFEDLTDTQIDAILDVHLKGAFYVGQPAYRAMKENKYGRFVFTGSASAMYGHAWQANYAAAKAGLAGLSHVVALEGARHGILSNLLMPTAQTRLGAEMDPGFMEVPSFAETLGRVDFSKFTETMLPEFNTPLVLYLASERCRSSHNLYSQLGNRYARVFIGAAQGWLGPDGRPPSPEELAENWAEVEDLSTYHMPQSVYEEFEAVAATRALQHR